MKKKITIILFMLPVLSVIPFYLLQGNTKTFINSPGNPDIIVAVLVVKPLKSFIDKRDNRTYKQIQIGNQVWMAENLNYGKLTLNMNQENNSVPEKSFYNNDTSIGRKMGALYTWEEATSYAKNSGSEVLQGLCPEGWHLPSDEEWSTLTGFLDPETASHKEGWLGKNIAVLLIDSSGKKSNFGLKFAGNSVSNWFFYLNKMAYFWTSTAYSGSSAWYRCVSNDSKQIYRAPGDIKLGMSIRCIKD